MSSHNGNEDNYSSKDKLTRLLTSIFDFLESESPDLLAYSGVNLRGALERYFYFDSILHPERINQLLSACSEKLSANSKLSEPELFEEYNQRYGNLGIKTRASIQFISWARVIKDLLKQFPTVYVNRVSSDKKQLEGSCRRVGFFVIDNRFISFFDSINNAGDDDQLLYFSTKSRLPFIKVSELKGLKVGVMNELLGVKKHPFRSVYVRVCIHYQLIYDALHKHSPDVLIFAEGTSHDEYCAALAARQLGIPSIRIQSGRASILHTGYLNMPFDKMLSWGEGFLQHYKSASPDSHHVVTGSPSIDALSSKISKYKKKPRVAVLTQPANMGWISEQDYGQLVLLTQKLLNKGVEVIVRMHPVDKTQVFYKLSKMTDKVKVLNSPEYSLAYVFSQVDCVISFASTVISEAAACNVVPVILTANTEFSLFPYPEKHRAALVSKTVEEASETVIRVLFQPDEFDDIKRNMKLFAKQFFGPCDGKSIERVRREIDGTILKKSKRCKI